MYSIKTSVLNYYALSVNKKVKRQESERWRYDTIVEHSDWPCGSSFFVTLITP